MAELAPQALVRKRKSSTALIGPQRSEYIITPVSDPNVFASGRPNLQVDSTVTSYPDIEDLWFQSYLLRRQNAVMLNSYAEERFESYKAVLALQQQEQGADRQRTINEDQNAADKQAKRNRELDLADRQVMETENQKEEYKGAAEQTKRTEGRGYTMERGKNMEEREAADKPAERQAKVNKQIRSGYRSRSGYWEQGVDPNVEK